MIQFKALPSNTHRSTKDYPGLCLLLALTIKLTNRALSSNYTFSVRCNLLILLTELDGFGFLRPLTRRHSGKLVQFLIQSKRWSQIPTCND